LVSLKLSCLPVFIIKNIRFNLFSCIGGEMVSVIALSVVDRGFEP
jgi:hypothetical protein